MRFNILLLLLTTLTTVTISQSLPDKLLIQSAETHEFWAISGSDVVLSQSPNVEWVIWGDLISPVNDPGLAVQLNGPGKPLTITPRNSNPNQRWVIKPNGPTGTYICPFIQPVICAKPENGKVIGSDKTSGEWYLIPVLE
ncbi:hypothetical protein RclHR1_02070002 [Rhizophagus clarus]|uniref:Ricin B lectin domain-containing protein n=1 Tax=Rhizophagus clarus TaxID=94130 RepID=A0A2Z6R4B4_9GLOM|nr:hypothetical protein RclHR1_02070002 [Rhizophagus clarus]GES87289.1 hypothetical protein GLOIN_2v1597489 [Rhizophagus clarus]